MRTALQGVWVGLLIAAALGLATGGTDQGKAWAGEEIPVGVIQPLSGPLAPFGRPAVQGIRLRVEEINQAGGVDGKPIRLIVEDNKGDKNESINAFTKLVGSDKVVCVIAPVTSNNTRAIRGSAKKFKIPAITPTATNDRVTLRNPYVFRTCFNDTFQGAKVAEYALGDGGFKKAAILIDMNSDYSKGLAKTFAEVFAKGGGAVVAEENYQQGDKDFGPQLRNAAKAGAEVIFVPGYPPELPLIVQQSRLHAPAAKFCGADGWDNPTVINGSGPAVEGSFLLGAFAREDERPVVQAFIQAYQEAHETMPGTFEALGYDTMSLLAEAMKGGADAESIQKGLLAVKDFEAVTGAISMTPEGDAAKSAVILEIVKNPDGAEPPFLTRLVKRVAP